LNDSGAARNDHAPHGYAHPQILDSDEIAQHARKEKGKNERDDQTYFELLVVFHGVPVKSLN
jgi:hypothetical protein